jgi:hypothetical protein
MTTANPNVETLMKLVERFINDALQRAREEGAMQEHVRWVRWLQNTQWLRDNGFSEQDVVELFSGPSRTRSSA